ncbi:MAG TPA: glycosyltransferase family 8 protein [Verrucomicrobiae bacterium]|nr:glycosyltransferase family 8 protein [Verrucomicrobiae bacterium]
MSASAATAQPLHVACAADAKYAPHCAAMLHSVLEHANLPVHIHFLHDERLPAAALDKLRSLAATGGARFDDVLMDSAMAAGLHVGPGFGLPTWYRSLLPIVRPDLDRALYLDCDVIAVDSLLPLWEEPLDGALIAAVRNVIEPKLATRHHALGIAAEHPYFNAGVMLMDLAGMRREDVAARLLEFGRRHGEHLLWQDQDACNYVFQNRCRYLHPRWNCQNSLFYWAEANEVFGASVVAEAVRAPAILHFEGPGLAKPWHDLNRHPLRQEYWRHARATPFGAQRPEGRTARAVLGRMVRRLRGLPP